MLKALSGKLKESLFSVIPVVVIVLILCITPFLDLSAKELITFLICSVLLIVGIALFNLGADISMSPMGSYMGTGLTKSRNLKLLLSVTFLMGLLITIAEPDLAVLATQVKDLFHETLLIAVVGIGVGLFLLMAVLKIIFNKPLSMLLMLFYMLLFALAALLMEGGKSSFIPLCFDSGGVTTGPITVPFIMALGLGIASTIGGHDVGENSFGLVALCSVGPVAAVMILALGANGHINYSLPDYSIEAALGEGVVHLLLEKALEVTRALGLIVVFFVIMQHFVLKLPADRIKHIFVGIVYAFFGTVLFLSAVTAGYMPVGFKIGAELAKGNTNFLIVFAFVIGAVTVLAEPAVHVLNKQVEEVTGGTVTKRSMMVALSIGVGVSIGLSIIRAIYGFSILYYLIPGYFISLALSVFVPRIYTAIAFDSGGVASGPLTSGFILPMIIGVCAILQGEANIMSYAFGIVAMVAMTPLITIQALGFKAIAAQAVRERIVMKRILDSDDEQIIYFDVQ